MSKKLLLLHSMKPAAPNPPWHQPWKYVNWISLRGMPHPPFGSPVYEGWKEYPHRHMLQVKHQIESLQSPEEWEIKKKITNPYEAIFSGADDASFPSVAAVLPLSRSYFKMAEMMSVFKLDIQSPLRTAHICEGPGGFIQNIVHYAEKKSTPITSIHAMTLKPSKSHIPGWRHSIHFLRQHRQIQLEYGADGTGNVLHLDNQRVFVQKASGSHIFTADGGFDFSVDYSNQEKQAFPLVFASFLLGLQTLAPGGALLIKLFDIYSQATQDLLLGSSLFFKEFTIYKPATSRPCNAERYFMAKGYEGTEKAAAWISHLQAISSNSFANITRLVSFHWPSAVLEAFFEQIHWQEQLQIQSIEDTIHLEKKDILVYIEKNIAYSREWCTNFDIPMRY
jgi:23S rRNA U2552 (ribose-2'-O)-methylase RlmE/FtsJ